VVSDTATADLVCRAAAATVGEDHVDIAVPLTVGDDVACFLERAPGCYFLVGAGHPERGPVPKCRTLSAGERDHARDARRDSRRSRRRLRVDDEARRFESSRE
jgi:hypothetical protein